MRSTFEQDIEAGRGAIDTEQYGRPEYTDEVNESAGMDTAAPAPSPPISGDNLDRGAIPEDESAGLDTAARAAPAPDRGNTPTSGLLADAQNSSLHKGIAGGIKSIVSYLMGADAMPPQALDGAGKTVDPRGEMNPSQRNLLAIQHARENGGDEAAWALMQSNRVAYNAQTAFGKAALQGTAQKPPNLMSAIDAANKAQANVLDGTNIEFKPLQGGQAVTATVTSPDGQPQQVVLSPQQFAKWLDVGGDGQWDKVMSASAVATLQKLAAEGPSRGAKTMSEWGSPAPGRGAQPSPAVAAPLPGQGNTDEPGDGEEPTATPTRKTAYGTAAAPSTINLSGSDEAGVDQPDLTNYDPQLKARAYQMFPGIGQTEQRDAWINAQENTEAERENKIGVAAEKGKNDIAKARATGEGRVDQQRVRNEGNVAVADIKGKATAEAQKQRALLEAQKMEQAGQREKGRMARAEIMNPNFLLQDDAARNAILKKYGIEPGEHAAAPQQQGAPAAPQRAQLSDGKYYIRGPDGKAKLDPNQNP